MTYWEEDGLDLDSERFPLKDIPKDFMNALQNPDEIWLQKGTGEYDMVGGIKNKRLINYVYVTKGGMDKYVVSKP